MEKAFLESCIADGMSLQRIGEEFGKDPSTVGYWVKKHGLRAAFADRSGPRGSLEKGELEELVNDGLCVREIAARLDRHPSTVRYWLCRYELRTRRGERYAEGRQARRAAREKALMQCEHHGVTEFIFEGRGSYRCMKCRSGRVAARRRKVKQILVAEAGGCCRLCGYSRCPAALQFHHVDPSAKLFSLGLRGVTRGIKTLREEAKKCILLCACCHAEVEAGFTNLSLDLKEEVLLKAKAVPRDPG